MTMLNCAADRWKLLPYIVFRCKTPLTGEVLLKNVVVHVLENRLRSSTIVEDWAKIVWQCHAGALLHKESLLVPDSYCGHLTDVVRLCFCDAVWTS